MYLDHYLPHIPLIQHTSSYGLRTAQISSPQKEQPGCTWTTTCYTQQAYNTPHRIDLGQPKSNHAFSSIDQKERATWMYLDHYLPHIPLIQHIFSYGLRTPQISCRTPKLEPISQIRLIKAFLRKSNRDVLGPFRATHSKHTTHLVVLT